MTHTLVSTSLISIRPLALALALAGSLSLPLSIAQAGQNSDSATSNRAT